jgi:GxxExxY protein
MFSISIKKRWLCYRERKTNALDFEEIKLDQGYRLDLLVENRIVVELKTGEAFTDTHVAQTLTYLKLGGFKLGLLINFNVKSLKDGIKRLII